MDIVEKVAVDVGPWGVETGEIWKTEIFPCVKEITVYSNGGRICGIQFGYCIGCKSCGSNAGRVYHFVFKDNEYLTAIKGEYDDTSLTALTFVTNLETYSVPGIAITGSFCLPIRQGSGSFVGFFGYATSIYVTAIGASLKPPIINLKPN